MFAAPNPDSHQIYVFSGSKQAGHLKDLLWWNSSICHIVPHSTQPAAQTFPLRFRSQNREGNAHNCINSSFNIIGMINHAFNSSSQYAVHMMHRILMITSKKICDTMGVDFFCIKQYQNKRRTILINSTPFILSYFITNSIQKSLVRALPRRGIAFAISQGNTVLAQIICRWSAMIGIYRPTAVLAFYTD